MITKKLIIGLSLVLSGTFVSGSLFAHSDCDRAKEVMSCLDRSSTQTLSVDFETMDQKTTAVVMQKADHKIMAELPCFRKATNTAPDKPQVMLECYDPMVMDSGYRVTLSTPDFTGTQWSTVSTVTIAGMQEVAKIACAK